LRRAIGVGWFSSGRFDEARGSWWKEQLSAATEDQQQQPVQQQWWQLQIKRINYRGYYSLGQQWRKLKDQHYERSTISWNGSSRDSYCKFSDESTSLRYCLLTSQVTVGGSAGLVYTPNSIAAAVGDTVLFTFLSANHTATQSAFTTPCEKLTGGTDSGFMPNANDSVVPAPQMAMQVTVPTPICKLA
jgi:plastocyanin